MCAQACSIVAYAEFNFSKFATHLLDLDFLRCFIGVGEDVPSFVCVLPCRLSSSERANFRPHPGAKQTNGLSPVCVRMWVVRWSDLLNPLPQDSPSKAMASSGSRRASAPSVSACKRGYGDGCIEIKSNFYLPPPPRKAERKKGERKRARTYIWKVYLQCAFVCVGWARPNVRTVSDTLQSRNSTASLQCGSWHVSPNGNASCTC